MPFQLSTVEPLPSVATSSQSAKVTHTVDLATFDPVQVAILMTPLELEARLAIQKLLELEIQTRYDLY